jgi:hypothetical protein
VVSNHGSKLRELEVKYPRVSIMLDHDNIFDSFENQGPSATERGRLWTICPTLYKGLPTGPGDGS